MARVCFSRDGRVGIESQARHEEMIQLFYGIMHIDCTILQQQWHEHVGKKGTKWVRERQSSVSAGDRGLRSEGAPGSSRSV